MRRILAVAVVLAAMACTNVEKGTIIKRSYTPAWIFYSQQCIGYDKNGGCTGWIFVPIYEPETYDLELRDDTQDKPMKDRDTGWVSVSESEYERYRVGGQYP